MRHLVSHRGCDIETIFETSSSIFPFYWKLESSLPDTFNSVTLTPCFLLMCVGMGRTITRLYIAVIHDRNVPAFSRTMAILFH